MSTNNDFATSRLGCWVAESQLSEKLGKCDLATLRLGRWVANSKIRRECDLATSRLGHWVAGRARACRGVLDMRGVKVFSLQLENYKAKRVQAELRGGFGSRGQGHEKLNRKCGELGQLW